MITISLCMIVKNESAVLGRCLESVCEAVDEIIVVDTGSTDDTKDIAASYRAKVYDFTWRDHFAAARNYAFSLATKDYILWLDADDVMLKTDVEKLIKLKSTLSPEVSVVNMLYHAAFDSKGEPTFSYNRERLLRRSDNPQWVGAVHEVIPQQGIGINSNIAVCHKKCGSGDPDRNLRIYEKRLALGEELDTRAQFYYGRELMFHRRWSEAIKVLRDFLTQPDAWLENQITACGDLATCYRNINDSQSEIQALLQSLSYDGLRAEICCAIGAWWLRRSGWRQGQFWYETALSCDPQAHPGAFVALDCYGYIPWIQLAVIYDHLGEYEKAVAANEEAGKIRPNDPAYLHNKAYFAPKIPNSDKN